MRALFDFGLLSARPIDRFRYRPAGAMWSWQLVFRDAPSVIWHIVRRTGNLKRWASLLLLLALACPASAEHLPPLVCAKMAETLGATAAARDRGVPLSQIVALMESQCDKGLFPKDACKPFTGMIVAVYQADPPLSPKMTEAVSRVTCDETEY